MWRDAQDETISLLIEDENEREEEKLQKSQGEVKTFDWNNSVDRSVQNLTHTNA